MPHVVDRPALLDEPSPPRWKCTVEAFEKLSTMGLLEGRYELLEGDIVEQMPVKAAHAYAIMLLTFALARLVGEEFLLANFSLWITRHDLPIPDLAVTSRPVSELLAGGGYVHPADVRLVVEVASTTLSSDVSTKARLYAGAEIPEYWVLDMVGRRLRVCRNPENGSYQSVREYEAGETVRARFAPDAGFTVEQFLPPVATGGEGNTE